MYFNKSKLYNYFPQILLSLVLIGLMILFSFNSTHFLTWDNFRNILDHTSLQIILAVGMTFVICTGGIDLSIGSVVALSGVIMAIAMKNGYTWQSAILFGILSSLSVGLFNGAFITFLKVNPFIVTLGSMSLIRGIALILTNAIPIYGFPSEFTYWGSGKIGPFNPTIITAFSSIVIGIVLLCNTKFGRYILALGGNEEALRRSGVSVKKYKILTYCLCAFTAGIGGLIVTARLNTAEPLAGWMFELDAIAAVVLGGSRMQGGKGSMVGTIIACFLLGIIRNGLTILNIPSYYQQTLIGLIILIAVAASELKFSKQLIK